MNKTPLSEYEGYKWAMEPVRLKSFFERLAALPISESVMMIEVAARPREMQIQGSTAVIPISGVLLKSVPSFFRFWGLDATGYDEIRDMISAAMSNKAITAIHLQIDSPGGQVDGLVEAADAIFAARAEKDVTATVEDLGASAAYWLASQAGSIAAGRNTEIGSIGVYTVYVDYTKLAEDIGARVIVIRSGPHKGMGVQGAEITDEQIAAIQKIIDAMADNFIDAVAAGRSMDRDAVAKLATGQLWIATAARELGLIDQVDPAPTIEQTAATTESADQVTVEFQTYQSKGDLIMQTENENQAINLDKVKADASQAAIDTERTRTAKIREEFQDDPEFAMEAVSQGWTLDQAKAQYCGVLKARLAETKTNAGNTAEGASPIATEGNDDQGGQDFIAAVEQLADEKKITKTEAMRQIRRRNPASHDSFLKRCDDNRGRGKLMYQEAV